MPERKPLPEDQEDPFAESDEWLAAEVRQLFRAHRAHDVKAVEVAVFYFKGYLTKILQRHLSKRDPAWDNSSWLGDNSSYRWFDGLSGEPEFPAPGRLRLRGEVWWVIGQQHWYNDMLDFEIELCPKTGAFRRYVIRFGDHRPLEGKSPASTLSAVPVGGWAYVFERRSPELDIPLD